VIGSLGPAHQFSKACPTHTEFTEFGPFSHDTPSSSTPSQPITRRSAGTKAPRLQTTILLLSNSEVTSTCSRVVSVDAATPFVHRAPETDHQPTHRNVVQEACRKGPALRHCGCRRPRVHHPHAQAGMFSLSPARTERIRVPNRFALDEGLLTGLRFKIHGVSFKKRAPRAIKEIKAFATKAMVRKPSHTPRDMRRRRPQADGCPTFPGLFMGVQQGG